MTLVDFQLIVFTLNRTSVGIWKKKEKEKMQVSVSKDMQRKLAGVITSMKS